MSLRNDYGFHEYTYQNREYIITICMLSAPALHSACNQNYTCGFPAPGCKCDCTLPFWVRMWTRCL